MSDEISKECHQRIFPNECTVYVTLALKGNLQKITPTPLLEDKRFNTIQIVSNTDIITLITFFTISTSGIG